MYRCTKSRLNLDPMATAARVSVLYLLPVPDSNRRGIGAARGAGCPTKFSTRTGLQVYSEIEYDFDTGRSLVLQL